MDKYPEHQKLKALNGANQTIGDFIEWLGEQGIELARWDEHGDDLIPIMDRRNDLIGRFFDIDQQRLEAEKEEMLKFLQST